MINSDLEIFLTDLRPAGWQFLSFQPAQSCWQQRRWLALRRSSWPLPAPLHPPSPNFESLKLTGLERWSLFPSTTPLLYLPLCFPFLAYIPLEYQRQKQTCLQRCPKSPACGFTKLMINHQGHCTLSSWYQQAICCTALSSFSTTTWQVSREELGAGGKLES